MNYEVPLDEIEDDYNNSTSTEEELGAMDYIVCEDCDYRWEALASQEDWDEKKTVCPMCGSLNVTQL